MLTTKMFVPLKRSMRTILRSVGQFVHQLDVWYSRSSNPSTSSASRGSVPAAAPTRPVSFGLPTMIEWALANSPQLPGEWRGRELPGGDTFRLGMGTQTPPHTTRHVPSPLVAFATEEHAPSISDQQGICVPAQLGARLSIVLKHADPG